MPKKKILLLALAGLTVVSVSFSLQGWRSRLLASDLWTAATSADNYISRGEVPYRGCLSSLRAYIPPGSNLMIIPGVALFRDQRLAEIPGAFLFTFGTLIGLFLLCRLYFGERCAWISVVLYAFSALGLEFAISLWPRGHPFFAVWFFYFLGRYHLQKSQLSLPLALLTWAVGMYYFMELAPLLIAIPIVVLATRMRPSSASLIALLGVILASGVLWMPYLRYEAQQDYTDLRALLSRNPVPVTTEIPGRYQILHAQSGEPLSTALPVKPGMSAALVSKVTGMAEALVANFITNTALPGAGGIMLALWLLGLNLALPRISGLVSRTAIVGLLAASGMTGMTFLGADTLMRKVFHHAIQPSTVAQMSAIGTNLVSFALALVLWSMFKARMTGKSDLHEGANPKGVELFTLCFVMAWMAIILLIPGVGNGRRLWWAWPIQVVFIVWFLRSLRRPHALLVTLAVFGTILLNQTILDRVSDWRQNGWAGKDAEVLHLLDVVHSLEKSGSSVSVGYIVKFPPWFPDFWKIGPGYKVGTDFDRYLMERYKVSNLDTVQQGLDPSDEYRIIQTDVKRLDDNQLIVGGVSMDGFEEVTSVSGYSLLRKTHSAAH